MYDIDHNLNAGRYSAELVCRKTGRVEVRYSPYNPNAQCVDVIACVSRIRASLCPKLFLLDTFAR